MKRFRHLMVFSLVAALLAPAWAHAYSPSSPEVRKMIDKATAYLAKASHSKLGGKCLIALAIIKAPLEKDPALAAHPQVKLALEACKQAARNGSSGESVYNFAVATMFLCELSDLTQEDYSEEIDSLIKGILTYQKDHGGFGYINKNTGDTSQTQYGVLCCWYAMRRGYDIPLDRVERVADWLLRTQDQSGGWGYQGVVDSNSQTLVTLSLSSAAAGSLYICADMLKMKVFGAADNARRGPNTALVEVKEPEQKQNQDGDSDKITGARMRPILERGNRWFAGNSKVEVDRWNYYYLYALERYMTFQEIDQGRFIKEPAWYNQGVEFMKTKQTEEGAFSGTCGTPCSTAFAVLFLTRSTQKTYGVIKPAETQLVGGHSLPDDVSSVRENKDGEVVIPRIVTDINKLVDALNDPNFAVDEEAIKQVMELPLDKVARDQDAVRLRNMVTADSFAARLLAVRALSKARKLENVPMLIYALSDPDDKIKREARNGLRLLSRKFQGFGLSDAPSEEEVERCKGMWKEWYLSVVPDGEFLD